MATTTPTSYKFVALLKRIMQNLVIFWCFRGFVAFFFATKTPIH
jgi:hypothetical protein